MTMTDQLTEKLGVLLADSVYETLGVSYSRAGYPVEFFNKLTAAGEDYYDSVSEIPEGKRMSLASEELAIQMGLGKAGQDPRKAAAFDDLFARNEPEIYMWQWTATGLRVPKGRCPAKYEKDGLGRKYWVRELLEGDKVVGEILVPEGHGRVVVEWDEVSGLPKTTAETGFPHKHYTTHFGFNPTPLMDSRSGHYDVAVGRVGGWLFGVDEGCLAVDARCGRLEGGSHDGFRLVKGPASDVEKKSVKKPDGTQKTVYL
ncbi:MAG: hypothetical protein HY516_00200 [Candidatus Aenigmarchaeota archaeon]|nr:hypothetical protein [Candidatus Aenigmarchaeota archaeon]